MLFASHSNGSTTPIYGQPSPQLVGSQPRVSLVGAPYGTQQATLVGAPNVTLVGATASTAAAPSGPIPLQSLSRAPIDASGRVVGSFSAMDRARAILQSTAIHRSADQLAVRPWQGGQLGNGIDPTAMLPGQYARAVRTGISVVPGASPTYWRPDAITSTGVWQQMFIRQVNPVESARQTIDPFVSSVRAIAPGISNFPGQYPVYRTYQPATVFDPAYPNAAPTSAPCPSCTYSPMVATQRVGTVPEATPQAATSTNRSAFGFYRA